MLPESIKKLSKILTKIPNIGPKSAERLAIWFAGSGLVYAKEVGTVLANLDLVVGTCPECGYFSGGQNQKCDYCIDSSRNPSLLCLVTHGTDIVTIEEAGSFKGRYFVLGGVISPLEGITISDLPFEKLKQKVLNESVEELIIALGATTEADVTSMYLKELFQDLPVTITVLGRGLAVGSQIHFSGKKSISEAFRIREILK